MSIFLRLRLLSFLAALLPLGTASAETVVLIHGYMSDAAAWEYSGINAGLRQAGWNHAASPSPYPARVATVQNKSAGAKSFYTVQLPSLAPVGVQASWLKAAVDNIARQHGDDSITLVGHSAGGVVARLMLIQYGAGKVNRLITIAAPHLGTDRAIQALEATDDSGMFGFIKEWFVRNEMGDGLYDTVQYSRGVLVDLAPPVPGSLLFWLNNQRHPDIEYVSIVRTAGYNFTGDLVVPPVSQDMNRVPALRGKSKVLITVQGHELTPADGKLLVDML